MRDGSSACSRRQWQIREFDLIRICQKGWKILGKWKNIVLLTKRISPACAVETLKHDTGLQCLFKFQQHGINWYIFVRLLLDTIKPQQTERKHPETLEVSESQTNPTFLSKHMEIHLKYVTNRATWALGFTAIKCILNLSIKEML